MIISSTWRHFSFSAGLSGHQMYSLIVRKLCVHGLVYNEVSKRWMDAPQRFNTLRPRQNGRHVADDIFKCIFLNENVWIPIKISLKFVPKDLINNIPALVQIMAWRRPGDKPLSESMMVSLPTHICVTRPQWVSSSWRLGNVNCCVL